MSSEHFIELARTVDDLIAWAGSSDFEICLKKWSHSLGEVFIIEDGTIKGFATHLGNMPIIAIHRCFIDTKMYPFTGWHELTHLIDGDVGQGSNSRVAEYGFFQHDVYDQRIPKNEKKCNLISAHVNVNTNEALNVIAYNSQTMKEFRELKSAIKKAKQQIINTRESIDWRNPARTSLIRLKTLQRNIESMLEELESIQYELMDMNAFKTFSEMASELSVPTRILKYKLEALRLLGYDIDPQELEDYGTMFEESN